MGRFSWIHITIAAQLTCALSYLWFVIYVLALIHRWGFHSDSSLHTITGAAMFLAPGAAALIAGIGVIRRKFWGWLIGLISDLAILIMLSYMMVDDGWRNLDVESVAFAVLVASAFGLLLTPSVVKACWRKAEAIEACPTVR